MRGVVFLLLMQSVAPEQAVLRSGCGEADDAVATLAKGTQVKIRFALAGTPKPCYAVTVESGGQRLQGYLWAESLAGLEKFDASRRQAAANTAANMATRPAARSPGPEMKQLVERSNYAAASEAGRVVKLLNANQPEAALSAAESALRENRKNADLLALAGMAAWQMDNAREARIYWTESLELRDDRAVRSMLSNLEREIKADKSTEKSYGTRFVLRYDGAVAAPDAARELVAALETEFSRIASQLGCRTEERIAVIVQSRPSYRSATGAAEWNGGQYDGRIRIPVDRLQRLDSGTRQTLAHELVHACMANLGRWPTWLHEGLAQKLAGESMDARARDQLRALAKAKKLPRLASLSGSWLNLDADQARLCYAVALAAAEALYGSQGSVAARNLLNNPERLAQTAADLDRALAASLQ